MSRLQNYKILIGLSALFYFLIGYFIPRSNFPLLICFYTCLFLFYLAFGKMQLSFKQVIWGGLLLRIILLFSVPSLSDDFYRFIWDGLLTQNGIHPFDFTPTEVLQKGLITDSFLVNKMNSPDYYSVYPTINQIIFYLSALFYKPAQVLGSVVFIRILVILAEVGSIIFIHKILQKLNLPLKNIWIYALNPLVILEFSGNLHFEVFMVFFLLFGFYHLLDRNMFSFGMGMVLAICTKLIPLLYVPFMIAKIGFRKTIVYGTIIVLCSISVLAVLYNAQFLPHFMASLQLYFKTFEFNSSLHQIENSLNDFGFWQVKYLHYFLEIALLSWLFWISYHHKILFETCLLALTVYLLFTKSVHPWYVAPTLVWCTFTKFKFPMIWSFLVFFTYITYQSNPYEQNQVFIIIEYSIVIIVALIEIIKIFKQKMFTSVQ